MDGLKPEMSNRRYKGDRQLRLIIQPIDERHHLGIDLVGQWCLVEDIAQTVSS